MGSGDGPLRLIDVAAPIHDDFGVPVGVMAAHLSWDWAERLRQDLVESLVAPDPVEVFVLNSDGKVVLDNDMESLGDRFIEVLVDTAHLESARALKPIDERSLPFGKTVMLFDGVPAAQLEPLGETRTPGLADLFVATMKGTYA